VKAKSAGWGHEELEGLDLGDARRNERAKTLVTRFAANPTASIPGACNGWAETMGAYRFLENEEIEWRGILEPHWQRTQQRMGEHEVVLCLQDSTELDFNGQEIEGLGELNYEARRGIYLHPTYAVTPNREPLGVLDAWMWARSERDEAGRRTGPKESLRWIEGYERIAEIAPHLAHTRLVYVADREADILALMRCAHELGTPADWLIRAKHDRSLAGGEKLWQTVAAGEVVGEIQFTLGARQGQKARPVKQEIRAQRVDLPAGKAGAIGVTCLMAREIDAPKGVKPVEWRLLTNRQATELPQLLTLIDWYRARWEIEIFFNVLKNGCRVEALQLSVVDRLERALALFMIVAWRIAHLMRMGRTCPDLDAALFFDPDEIRGAYLLTKKRVPDRPPRLNEVLRLIAQLGGFLGRKGDGEPGAKTIWTGLQQVAIAAQTLQALRE